MANEVASTETRLLLGSDEAHLHVLRLPPYEAVTEAALLARFGPWMNPEEATRQARFVFEKGRREYLMTRALVRGTLSRYADVPPEAWAYRKNAWGKPELASDVHGKVGLHFNLSNTDGCVVMLIARGRDVGVDVEHTGRRVETLALAESHFSPSEYAALVRLADEAAQHDRFFDLWTLKEAYIKARGMGLALALDGFTFDLETAPPDVLFSADGAIDPQPARWQFLQHDVGGLHRVASAIERTPGTPVRVTIYDATAAPTLRPTSGARSV